MTESTPPPASLPGSPSATAKEWPAVAWLVVLFVFFASMVFSGGRWASRWSRPASAESGPTGLPPSRSGRLGPFALTNQAGRRFTSGDVAHHWLAVSFVFTSCSSSCLQVSQNLATFRDRHQADPEIRIVSFSVDPRTDSPAVLATFGQRYGAQTGSWDLLTGPQDELYTLLENSFLDRTAPEEYNPMPGRFRNVDHVALVDPKGHVVGLFNGMKPDLADRLDAAMKANATVHSR